MRDKLVLWKIMRSLCAETESSCNLVGCDTEIEVMFLVHLLFNLQQKI